MPASEDLNGNDLHRFIDVDEHLSGIQHNGSTSEDPDCGTMEPDPAVLLILATARQELVKVSLLHL